MAHSCCLVASFYTQISSFVSEYWELEGKCPSCCCRESLSWFNTHSTHIDQSSLGLQICGLISNGIHGVAANLARLCGRYIYSSGTIAQWSKHTHKNQQTEIPAPAPWQHEVRYYLTACIRSPHSKPQIHPQTESYLNKINVWLVVIKLFLCEHY